MAVAFDTLAYARRLRGVGFSEQQAEGQAEALAVAMTDTIATKQDLVGLELRIEHLEKHLDTRFVEQEARTEIRSTELEKRLDTRFAELEKRLDARSAEHEARYEIRLTELEKRLELRFDGRMTDLERRLTLRMGGMMVAGFTVVSALVKLL